MEMFILLIPIVMPNFITRIENYVIILILIWFLLIFPLAAFMKFNYTTLAIDYDNYMVNYNCINIEGGKSTHSAWVAGRRQTLNATLKIEVDNLVKNHFATDAFFSTYQNDDFCAPRVNLEN